MSKIGTFGSFTQARLAIYAAQLGLSVTGNNISNVNTPGYTRQRLEQVSFKTGGSDRYQSTFDIRVGNGVLPTGVSQLRDPYLDIRYRNENSSVGSMDATLGGLEKIAAILDEVGKGGEVKEGEQFGIIAYQLGNLFQALSGLTDQTGQQEYDVQVRSSADSLCQELRSYASQLEELYDDTVASYNQNITTVNKLLTNIRDLNATIRKSDIHGDKALELRDQRNNLIDELSTYMKIDVTYTTEDIGAGKTVEKLVISLGNSNPDKTVHTDESVLIDGRYCTQLMTATPRLNEEKAGDVSTYKYYTGTPGFYTNKPEEAQKTPLLNTNPETKDELPYLNDLGQPVKEAQHAVWVPVENPDYKPYLTKDGTPTDQLDEAEMLELPNFGLRLSELRDDKDRLLETVQKMEERIATEAEYSREPVSVHLPDGTIKITTYRAVQQRLLKNNDAYDKDADFAADFPDEEGPDPAKPEHAKYFKYIKTVKDNNGNETASYTNDYKEADREIKTTYYAQDYIKTPSAAVDLDDNDLYGALQSQRELLTEQGEFSTADTIQAVDENAATKRGIQYYQKVLDLLAHQIATSFNQANQGYLTDKNGNYITETTNAQGKTVGVPLSFDTAEQAKDEDGNLLFDNGNPVYVQFTLNKDTKWTDIPPEVQAQMQANDPNIQSVEDYLKQGGKDANGDPAPVGIFVGGNLFSNNGDSDSAEGITASNISVSASWSKGPLIVNSFICPPGETTPASTDSSNILNLKGLQYEKMEYLPRTFVGTAQDKAMFTGTFEEMWTNIGTVLGHDQKVTSTLLDNYYEKTVNLDSSRASVSSVDFNDEAMNLMQYSKSYNAACRLMTTLDSVLDKLINGTGLTT